MKILLIQPPFHDFYATIHRTNALGLHIAADLLKEAGYNVEVINFPLLSSGKTAALPDELSHLKPYLLSDEKGPVKGLNHFQRFGPSFSEACNIVEAKRVDLIILALFAWPFGEDLLQLAREYRVRNPDHPMGIAGAGFSAAPERFITSGLFSLFLEGEAEGVIPLWLEAGSPLKGHFSAGFDPERKPLPGAVSFPLPGRNRGNDKALAISAGRGCPMSCRFCANHLVHGRGLRLPRPGDVLRKIDSLPLSAAHVKKIFLEDDNPSADIRWFKSLLTALHERFPQAEISAENGMDHRFLAINDLPFLWDKGFRTLNLSLGSSTASSLSRLDRGGSMAHFQAVVESWAKLGGKGVNYFIAGLPGEKGEESLDSLITLSQLPGRAGISLYYPLPDSDTAAPFRRYLGSAAWRWGGELSTPTLLTLFRLSRYLNMMKSGGKGSMQESLIRESRKTGYLHTFRRKEHSLTILPWSNNDIVSQFFNRVIAITS